MRFDSINLIGDFQIKGKTGGTNQFIGASGGNLDWITVTTTGGTGAQGYDGPNLFCIPTDKIIVGNGSNVQYTSMFEVRKDIESFNLGTSNYFNNYNLLTGIINSNSSFMCTSYLSTILSSKSSRSKGTRTSTIISSGYTCLYCQYGIQLENSSIISSRLTSILNSPYSSIISSYQPLYAIVDSNNSIVSGSCNSKIYDSSGSSIHSSRYNRIFETIKNSKYNSIIGGYNNVVADSYYSSIIGGENNSSYCSYNSVILGGANNQILGSTNSVILGGSGLIIQDESETTLSQRLMNVKKITFKPLDQEPDPLEVGMLWFKDNQLWIQLDIGYTVSLIPK